MAKISMLLFGTFLMIVYLMCETQGASVRRFDTKCYQPKPRASEKATSFRQTCVDGWLSFNYGHCYLVVMKGKPWNEATARIGIAIWLRQQRVRRPSFSVNYYKTDHTLGSGQGQLTGI